jgi:stage II sporulation protein D
VQVGDAGGVRRVPLEDYVAATVVSESAPSGDPSAVERMFEVQAIVARSYALASRGRHGSRGFDLCSTTHCQLYAPDRLKTSRWGPLVVEAVRRTAGVVVWHRTAPALALFHADCGGHTSTAGVAWGGADRPYLLAVPDAGPALSAHAQWTYEIEADRMVKLLGADARTAVGRRLDMISVLDRDPAGRAGTIALHGERERLVSGEILRDVVSRQDGARTLRSTMFEVRRDQSRFVFEGRGFGHGVGLCQAGALARIKAGARPRDVLAHYYAGASLRSLQ